jgi:hypothetical protein
VFGIRITWIPVRDPQGSPKRRRLGCFLGSAAKAARPPRTRPAASETHGVSVLDVVYILGIIAVFVLLGLIAKGVEKL